jgi:glyoxylase-like metal-dependent hydrolase (beta-lactamase superfamily II)
MDNNTYAIADESGAAAIVDPSFGAAAILSGIRDAGCDVKYVLNTHAHFDHIAGNGAVVAATGALLALHPGDLELLRAMPIQAKMFGMSAEPSPEPAIELQDGMTIPLGATSIRVVHTPGHSPGHVTFLLDEDAIVGDCLFQGSIGRTDLPGGSFDVLIGSIRSRLLTLPDSTRVWPGHGEPTTIGIERATNPFLAE